MCRDILLRQKIQQPCIQIDLTIQIQGIYVFDRDGRLRQLAVFRFCLQVEGVILPCEASASGDVIVSHCPLPLVPYPAPVSTVLRCARRAWARFIPNTTQSSYTCDKYALASRPPGVSPAVSPPGPAGATPPPAFPPRV